MEAVELTLRRQERVWAGTVAGLILLCAVQARTATASPGLPAPGAERALLVLESGEASRPAALELFRGLHEALTAGVAAPPTVYTEAPDLYRFGDPEHARAFAEYVRQRYRGRPIDAILASGDPAVKLLLGVGQELWPDVPRVALVVSPHLEEEVRRRPGWTGLRIVLDVDQTLDVALALLPESRRVAFVSGHDPYAAVVETALAARRDRLETVRLLDLTVEETRRRIAALPTDAIVFYGGIMMDGSGRRFTPQTVLDALAPASNRPVFGYLGTYLGHGIVGGALLDLEKVGFEAGRLSRRVLSGEAPESMPVRDFRPNSLLFDGRQLERWSLSATRLPPGSHVLFREPALWEEHRVLILATVAALVIQAALIGTLFFETQRRQRAQRQLRALSARLLTAQEGERSRIARELHDDVSQRLALLAIELDQLCAKRQLEPVQREAAAGLSGQVRALSSDVHRIAYELHPAILDQLGLLPALRRFAEEISHRYPLEVDVAVEDWPENVPRDVALAFYRVAQEALQNAARHSGAPVARVLLRGGPRALSLTVTDGGRGFDRPSVRGTHLGLAGMRERLRQVGGFLSVESIPDRGTLVAATIPHEAVALHQIEAGSAGSRPDQRASGDSRPDEEAPAASR